MSKPWLPNDHLEALIEAAGRGIDEIEFDIAVDLITRDEYNALRKKVLTAIQALKLAAMRDAFQEGDNQ